MFGFIGKIFTKMMGGTRNDRLVRGRMKLVVEQINPLEDEIKLLSEEQLLARSLDLRERRLGGANRKGILPEAFALMREASRRGRNHRQYDVQLVAGTVLDDGWIAEEATGEGKTIACYPAIYMTWLEGKHTHVVTVNDYLVVRDAKFAAPIFELLGAKVGYITSEMEPAERKPHYECAVTYGTNSEFGFDYLRDNMKLTVHEQVQGPLDFAIVDEVDSILIDEARTPLIISGGAAGDINRYRKADGVARELIKRHQPWAKSDKLCQQLNREIKMLGGEISKVGRSSDEAKPLIEKLEVLEQKFAGAERDRDSRPKQYEIELDRKAVNMTHDGIGEAQDIAGVGSFYVGANMEWPHLMDQSLRAHLVYELDKDYVVQDGIVIIVDEFTGRLMHGRQWSDGLHQAVEAKECVTIKEETQTLATITLQNYFKLYDKLAGMTGTALTEAEEFMKIYSLDVVAVPTNVPCQRDDQTDRIYASEEAKYRALVEEIHAQSLTGRPVLVGTTSIEKSEFLSTMLKHEYGIQHEVLNGRAENAAREAEIVDKAGHQRPLKPNSKEMVGNVTIATNMAGRGTDIKLSSGALAAGGLHIVGTERHESRRIDNQLRGRAGRQGDPGSSLFFLSLRDDLMAIFASEMMLKMLARLGFTGDQHIESRMLSRGVEKAQRKVEERNFEIRKSLLEYDEVMDFQRKAFYEMRQRVLEGRDLRTLLDEMNVVTLDDSVWDYLDGNYARRCVGEFARQQLQCPVVDERIKLRGNDLEALEHELREFAKSDAVQTINITLGEYLEEDLDAKDWDYRGLSQWAMSRFSVQLSQNQLRKMDEAEIENTLAEAAAERIDAMDLSGLAPMLEERYAYEALCDWARAKFDFEITADELGHTPEEARDALDEKVRDAYRKRVIEYPCEHAIEMTVGNSSVENVYALDSLATWANMKYGAGWTGESLAGRELTGIYNDLVALSAKWNAEGYISESLREALGDEPTMEAVCEYLDARYNINLDVQLEEVDSPLAIAEKVVTEFLRREMTELERYVLLQLCDTTWKDHLLNMDNLKGSIHLRGYAEQDPKVAFKREGSRMFEDMLASVRERVTDMIFKVRLASTAEMESVYQISNQVHEQLQGYDHLTQDMAAQQEAGVQQAVKPIINTGEKVGRNDPCPCGSGRKYKKCCGKDV